MPFDASLSAIEAQLQDIQAALLPADPLTLEPLTGQLRTAATALAHALDAAPARTAWPDGLAARIQAIASQLAAQRDQLARILALTERQAASLLPPVTGVSTYSDGAAPRTAAAPRIYRAPG